MLRPPLIRNSDGRLRTIDRGGEISAASFIAAAGERSALYRRGVRFVESDDVLVLPVASVLP